MSVKQGETKYVGDIGYSKGRLGTSRGRAREGPLCRGQNPLRVFGLMIITVMD